MIPGRSEHVPYDVPVRRAGGRLVAAGTWANRSARCVLIGVAAGAATRHYSAVDVTLWFEEDGCAVKVQAHDWEFNLRASAEELRALEGIRSANWDERRSIRTGESAGKPVFWACDGTEATVMIGDDDETWDIAITMPLDVVDDVVRKVREEASNHGAH